MRSTCWNARRLAQKCIAATEASWLLPFDQDSQIDVGYVRALTQSPALDDPQTAIVAPIVFEQAMSRVVQGHDEWSEPTEVRRVITSGALCRVAAIAAVGGVRTDLFIDYVDYDLCLRLRTGGWKMVVEPAARMNHRIGEMSRHRLIGVFPVFTSNHSADRQYYKYRNYVLLARDGTLWRDPTSAVLDGAALLWGPAKVLLFEGDRVAKLRAMAQGVRDGIRGRAGVRAPA